MIKIILGTVILIALVLALNSFWSGGSPSVNLEDGRKTIQVFQDFQRSLPQRMINSATGAVKGVETGITEYFMKKTGGEVVDLLKDLPPKQQEVIKNEYCTK